MLRLHVDLCFSEQANDPLFGMLKDLTNQGPDDRIILVVEGLTRELWRIAREICDHLDIQNCEAEVRLRQPGSYCVTNLIMQQTLALASQLIKEVDFLVVAANQDLVDYSSVFFISRLLPEQLAKSPQLSCALETYVESLSSLLPLDSGYGLSELWAAFDTGLRSSDVTQQLMTIANLLSDGQNGATSVSRLRLQNG